MPYGFPSGAKLTQSICRLYRDAEEDGFMTDLITRTGLANRRDIAELATALQRSSQISVDTFLAKRPKLSELGKLCIAAELCMKENYDNLYSAPDSDDWHKLLWNMMQDGVHRAEDIKTNAVRFVTFNYERSLETFLYEAARNSFDVAPEVAAQIVRSLSIIHPYGMLGDFETRSYSETDNFAKIDPKTIATAAKGLKVIPDTREDEQDFLLIRNWAGEWAEQICFLGFGFDPLNMQRLGLHDVFEHLARHSRPTPSVTASVLGKTPMERAHILNTYFSRAREQNFIDANNVNTLRQSTIFN